ncbi:MAG: hypothetical protein KAJ40_06895 [Alphaproteobacteria bacterium]|nr:hypothetical protein [Alphaproteobacteria bacterium]
MPRWTPKTRAKQRENIMESKPWGKSTGPKTIKGKAIVACNPIKHGLRSKEGKALLRILYAQSRHVRKVLDRCNQKNAS